MLFSAWSPFGPIFGKELRTASRRKRNYLLRVVYLGSLLLFLLWAYAITRSSGFYRGAAAQAQQNEQLGWLFFMFFSMFTVIAMGLVAPVLTSTAINSERLNKTLHVLLMTPLTAWQIVSGKLFSRLLTALTLIGLTLPVLALVRLLGGVELQQMFGVLCLCVVTAMTAAAMGLLLSIVIHRAYAVILLSYFIIGIAYLFTPMMILTYAAASGRMGGMRWMSTISNFNPFWATAFLASGQMRIVASNWVPCVFIHLAVTALLLFASAMLVRRIARREGEGALPVAPPTMIDLPPVLMPPGNGDVQTAAQAAPIQMAMPSAVPSRRGRTVSDFPVLWRELRRPLMMKNWQRFVGVLVVAALLTLTYGAGWANSALKDDDFHISFGIIFYTLLMLVTCVLAATCIAQEKEGDTWIVLLASPLSGESIVFGKTLGVMRRLMWPVILIGAHFVIFTLGGVIDPGDCLVTLWVTVTFNLIWLAAGVFLSLKFRKVTIAVIVCLALPVALYGALSLVLVVLDALFSSNEYLIEQATWYMPYYYIVETLSRRHSGGGYDMPGNTARDVPFAAFATVAFIVGVIHIALSAAILWVTAKWFDRIVGRAPQSEPMPITSHPPRANLVSGTA